MESRDGERVEFMASDDVSPGIFRRGGRWVPGALLAALVLFVAGQTATLSYGTRINDAPYVAQYQVDPAAARGSA
jgi:hypothetical protein